MTKTKIPNIRDKAFIFVRRCRWKKVKIGYSSGKENLLEKKKKKSGQTASNDQAFS